MRDGLATEGCPGAAGALGGESGTPDPGTPDPERGGAAGADPARPRTGLGPAQVASLGEELSAASSPGRAEPSSLGTPPPLPSRLRVNTRLPGPGITRGYFGARIKPESAWGRAARPRWPRRPCLAFASRGSEVVCSPRSAQVPGRGRERGARGRWGSGFLRSLRPNPSVPVSLGPPGPHTTDWGRRRNCVRGFRGKG